MRWLVLLIILSLPFKAKGQCPGGSCPPGNFQRQPQPQQPTSPIPSGAVGASVRIEVTRGPVTHGGSGVVVAKSDNGTVYILTNRHVVGTAGAVGVQFADGRSEAGVFIRACTHADLALVAISSSPRTTVVATVAEQPVQAGEAIWQVGYPHLQRPPPRQRTGRARGLGGIDTRFNARVLELDLAVQQGDSGSGVFRANGELVGVIWGGSMGGRPSSSAVGVEDIQQFMELCVPGFYRRQPRQPVNPAPMQPVAPIEPPPPVVPSLPPALPGPAGPKGDPGAPGEKGPPGKDADNALLVAKIASLEAALAQQAKDFNTKLNNLSGSIRVQVTPVPKK